MNNSNYWIVKTRRGKKIINIDPAKHRVIMGRLHDAETYSVIGEIVRQATPGDFSEAL